jgi:MATE family multidrug resistance protein
VLHRGLLDALWIGIVSTTLLLVAGPPLMHMAGLDADLADGASRVLIVFALSITPYLIADTLIFWFEGHEEPERPMIALWLANAVNLALALWLVPGGNPFGVSGAVGAGFATLGARTFLLVTLALMLFLWKPARGFGAWRRHPRDRAAAREQRRLGHATGVSYILEGGGFSLLNFIAGHVSVVTVAAWAVVANVAAIVFMLPLGIANATAVLVSRSVGARHLPGVLRAYRLGLAVSLMGLAVLSVILWWATDFVASAYTKDPAVLALLPLALALNCLFYMADGAQVVSANALRARGDIWWPTRMHTVSYILVMLPVAWGLAVTLGMGLEGIMWALIVASFVSAGGLIWRFRALGDRMSGER